jgi:ribonucleotide monophosphatase NagD (HAD superfamily)
MLMARALGMDFALVLTGATAAGDVPDGDGAPEHMLASLLDLAGAEAPR